MIDYGQIIENLELEGVEKLLTSLGIPYRDTEAALIMPTVCHNADIEEASWKLYYYKNSHMFYCYTECGAQSIFKFLQHFYETRQIEYDWYNDILQVILNCSAANGEFAHTGAYRSQADNYRPQKIRRELQTYPEGLLSIYDKYYPIEWLQDSITKEAMDKFNIKFSHTENKIIIPHYNIHNELVGIRGRALNAWEVENVGKYAPVWIEGKCYSHPLSLNLYGLNQNKDNIRGAKTAFIFESEKSVLQFESFHWANFAVASCGSNLNKYQIDLLLRTCQVKNVVVCYDNEENDGEHKYFDKLYNMCKKYINYCDISFIYDRENITKKKDSPSDDGEKVFEELYNRRVKVK